MFFFLKTKQWRYVNEDHIINQTPNKSDQMRCVRRLNVTTETAHDFVC